MPRDLKDPDGWRFSSLRKMRLLQGFVSEIFKAEMDERTSQLLWRVQMTR